MRVRVPPRALRNEKMSIKIARERVREIVVKTDGLDSCYIAGSWKDPKTGKYDLTIQVESSGLTFAVLEQFSRLFDTKAIDIDSCYEEGCPTCGGTSYVELEIRGATLPE